MELLEPIKKRGGNVIKLTEEQKEEIDLDLEEKIINFIDCTNKDLTRFLPGVYSFFVLKDIPLTPYKEIVKAGAYCVSLPNDYLLEKKEKHLNKGILTRDLLLDTPHFVYGVYENNRLKVTNDLTVTLANLGSLIRSYKQDETFVLSERFLVGQGKYNHNLTLGELAAAAIIQDLTEEIQALTNKAEIEFHKAKIDFITNTYLFASKEDQGAYPEAVYTNKLDKTTFTNALIGKCFKGVEEMAKGKYVTGKYTLTPKNSNTKSDTGYFFCNPDQCIELMANKDASALFLKRVLSVIVNLLKQCVLEKRNLEEVITDGSIVYITTNTILKEITRTEQGVSPEIKRSQSSIKLINDAIRVLDSSQFEAHDYKGKMIFHDKFIDIAGYRDRYTYKGQILNHVWGFNISTLENKLTQEMLKKSTTQKRLDIAPMRIGEAWIDEYLNSDLLSRGLTVLKKSKDKPREATVKESWSSIFAKGKPTKKALPAKTKQTIINNLQKHLRAIAKVKADSNKNPVFIKARTTRKKDGRGRGKGSLQNLELYITDEPLPNYLENIENYIDLEAVLPKNELLT